MDKHGKQNWWGRVVIARRSGRALLGGLALISINACSTVSVSRVKPNDYDTKGVRYWLSAPYLFVTAPVVVSQIDTLWEVDGAGHWTQVSGPQQGAPSDHPQAGQGAGAPGQTGPGNIPPPQAPTAAGPPPAATPEPGKGDDKSGKPEKNDQTAGMSIVWLPDYCQQYAISQQNFIASQTLQLKLADGSKLDSVNSQLNSTEVVSKLLDTISAVAGAALKGAAPAPSPTVAAPVEQPQAGTQKRLFRRTEANVIEPGVYRLFGQSSCDTVPQVSAVVVPKTVPSITWTEVTSTVATGVTGGTQPRRRR